MPTDMLQALAEVFRTLRAVAERDPAFREQLRALATAALRMTEPPPPAVQAETAPTPVPSTPPRDAPAAIEPPRLVAAPQPIAARPVAVAEGVEADLLLIGQRLRIKAEGARWAATRRRRLAERADYDAEIEPADRALIERAKKLPDCFLWMNHPSGPSPSDLRLLDDLAGCFDAAADAVMLVQAVVGNEPGRGVNERALELLAGAQSALRVAVESVGQKQDNDQYRAYLWLRDECGQAQVYIPRFMRMEDAADPATWPAIAARIAAAAAQVDQARNRARQQQAAMKRLRYHLKPVTQNPTADHPHDWEVIIRTVDQMVTDGLPPSNAEVRELLVPVIDGLPGIDLPDGFSRVVREIDAFLASRGSTAEAETKTEPTAQVNALADLLRGRTLVLIGGARRPQAHDALRRAFGLKDVDWIETREHESVTTFEPHIARPEVAVVVLAIRWSSHGFGDVKLYCDKHGKPLVRLPAGYNPNQVAAQVLEQCGDRLALGK